MQLFCGIMVDPENPIKNGRIVSAIRNRLGRVLDINRLQTVLFNRWKSELKDLDLCLTDVTCYESHLRYPSDVLNCPCLLSYLRYFLCFGSNLVLL